MSEPLRGSMPRGRDMHLDNIRFVAVTGAVMALAAISTSIAAQGPTPPALTLERILAEALAANPGIMAATARVVSERANAAGTGRLPDPHLMIGAMSVRASTLGFSEDMSQKVVGVTQRLPYPGKLALERDAATSRIEAAQAREDDARLMLILEARRAWYDLALVDTLLSITARRRDLRQGMATAAEAGYRAGEVGQEAVWRSRVELARIADEASALVARRQAKVATLNALRGKAPAAPIPRAELPPAIVELATTASAPVAFQGDTFGAMVSDSGIPPLDSMLAWSRRENTMIHAHEARIAAQSARVALARKAALPDFDFSLQYGQRNDRNDLLSASIAIPLALRRGRIQDQRAMAAELELQAEHAEHEQMVLSVADRIATLRSAAVAARTRLVVYDRLILPQGAAALRSALDGMRVGRTPFITVLEAETALYDDHVRYVETLTAFATMIAELDAIIGREVLP